jgi:hypothetical protein
LVILSGYPKSCVVLGSLVPVLFHFFSNNHLPRLFEKKWKYLYPWRYSHQTFLLGGRRPMEKTIFCEFAKAEDELWLSERMHWANLLPIFWPWRTNGREKRFDDWISGFSLTNTKNLKGEVRKAVGKIGLRTEVSAHRPPRHSSCSPWSIGDLKMVQMLYRN